MNNGKNILVVDDEPDIRIFLQTALEDAGFCVATAGDGDEALRAIKKQIPDLISLDLVMPRKSGIKFLYELRHNRDWARIPVIIVTGHAREEKVRKEMDDTFAGKTIQGPQVYLEKPVKPADYVSMVRRELGVAADDGDAQPASDPDVRKEIKELADLADPETLREALQLIREKKK